MTRITKVLNGEVGKKEDLRRIAENPPFMAFENAYRDLIVFTRIMGEIAYVYASERENL